MDSSRDIVKKLRENRLLNERKEYEKMEDAELAKLAKEGDQFALRTLIEKYDNFFYRMTKKYVPEDTFDRDDIRQTAEIAFWEAIKKWDGTGSLESFAGMVVKNRLINEYDKLNTEKSKMNLKADYLDAPSASDDEGGEMTMGDSMPSKSLSPEEEYLGNEGARRITEFIKNDLSETERKVILKYIEGYKVSEISEEMDMKYKTVENAIMRVKNKLADYMRNMKESKQLRMNESIFSDEEKEILVSVINKIDNKSITEASNEYEMDDEDKLSQIESDAEAEGDIIEATTSQETYEEALAKLDELEDQVYDILDNTEDAYLANKAKEVLKTIEKNKELYPENVKKPDPYAERGVNRADFF